MLIYLYDNTNSPVGMMYRTNAYAADTYDYFLFEKNLQGDIVAVYNASGTKLLSYTYDAWGNCTVTGSTTTGAQYNPFRYRGYYYDSEIGLYYLNSRYYDANTGRFINADVYVNANGDLIGYNMYTYCSNNPIMGYDPTGSVDLEKVKDWIKTKAIEGFETLKDEFLLVVDSMTMDIGFGSGLGASVEFQGMAATIMLPREDFITFRKEAGKPIRVGKAYEEYFTIQGAFCDIPTGKKSFIPYKQNEAEEEILYPSMDFVYGWGASAYAFFGGTIWVGFDIAYYIEQRYNIVIE